MSEPGVPDGWETVAEGDCIMLTSRDGHIAYSVSIDLHNRGFRYGWSRTGPLNSARFAGRGWRRRLVDAAVAWLREASQ